MWQTFSLIFFILKLFGFTRFFHPVPGKSPRGRFTQGEGAARSFWGWDLQQGQPRRCEESELLLKSENTLTTLRTKFGALLVSN